ncbi:uncharacterized protein C8A04DRAFT_12222 [Dichotomopilus funicola]|uniref:RRM domain-containing protein n=1 Tax=Dichotomopilus funicola TaxID=1934379 RepID=A0AAN6ZLF2_9PEZI|nr:hypothetical protein C8A04DRAFT_12222 [Dichotomopilus funicola]
MNQIRAIQALNKREIENGVPPEASWHTDYRDTAFVYFGGLPYELSEGDVITIFSQYGEPVFLKLARDKETGKSKGFGWLKYEDQRSTDLAVDNLGGAEIGGRLVRVDHARYKVRDDEDLEEYRIGWEDMLRRERAEKGLPSDGGEDETDDEADAASRPRPMIKEEQELQYLLENHDDDDPMKEYLVEEKKKEVEEALQRNSRRSEKASRRHRDKDKDKHRHHRSHRSRRDGSGDDREERHRYRDREDRDDDRKSRSTRNGDQTPVEDPVVRGIGRGRRVVATEMIVSKAKIGGTVIGGDGTLEMGHETVTSVGSIVTWRIGDGMIEGGVEAARRALTGINQDEEDSW